MKYKLLLLVFGFFLFTASTCERSFDIDTLENTPNLVLNSIFTPQKPLTVTLAASRPITGADSRELVLENVSVEITEPNGNVIPLSFQSLQEDGMFSNWFVDSTFFPEVGVNYTINATANSVAPVVANNTIPELVEVLSADFDSTLVEDSPLQPGKKNIWVNVSFQLEDKPTTNFYHFYAYRQKVTFVNDTGTPVFFFENKFLTNDLVDLDNSVGIDGTGLVYTDNSLLFKDEGGGSEFISFDIAFSFISAKETVRNLRFELRTVSEEYYNFHVAKRKQELVRDDEFAEPIISFSNIEGGLGLFGGYNFVQIDSLKLK